jgi:hypothetical protein
VPARTSPIYMKLKSDLNSIVNKVVLGRLTPEVAAAHPDVEVIDGGEQKSWVAVTASTKPPTFPSFCLMS